MQVFKVYENECTLQSVESLSDAILTQSIIKLLACNLNNLLELIDSSWPYQLTQQ
jgi:hypothetical protein